MGESSNSTSNFWESTAHRIKLAVRALRERYASLRIEQRLVGCSISSSDDSENRRSNLMTPKTENLVEEIRAISEDCTEVPIDNMISNPYWGESNVESARGDLERALNIFKYLLILPIDNIPDDAKREIIESSLQIQKRINLIRSFNVNIDDSYVVGQDKGQVVGELKKKVDDFYTTTQKWIPYLFCLKGDAQTDKLTSVVEDAYAKKSEIEEITRAAKVASASAGVAHFTADFSDQATDLSRKAKWWLCGTGIFFLITLAVAFSFLFYDIDPKNGYAAVHVITTKLIILSVLFSATFWCGRIYKIFGHQVTINKHRANSLRTFQAFVLATNNDETRDAVLMETTKSIFGSAPTGYLDEESSGSKDAN